MLREGRTAFTAIVESVRKRASAGDASGYDLERLELELAAYDDQIMSAETDLLLARRALARLAGDGDALYDAIDPLALPQLPAEPDALVSTALAGRGDYRAALLRVEQGAATMRAAGRAWLPTLAVTGGLKTADLGDETAAGYVIGLAIDIPLFDRGQTERARGHATQLAARADARLLEQEIPSLVRSAYDELERRIDQAGVFEEKQLARVGDLVRKAEVAYREGDRPILDLLDAHRNAREVRLRFLDLRLAAKRSELNLWRSLGRKP